MATPVRPEFEIERLRSEVATLEQLLAVHEKTALQQARRLENIVDSISDGFLVLDGQWRVTHLNPVAAATFERLEPGRGDLLGRPLWTKFPQLAGSKFERHCHEAMTARVQTTFEMHFAAIDTYLEVHAYPWEQGITLLLQDITLRKRDEQRRELMQAELETRVQQRTAELQVMLAELEAFSYSVSHDLRAPLRSLDGFSQALLEDYGTQLEADGKMYLDRIRANAQKMAQLIDALLQLSRVTRAELKPAPVDLSELVRQIAADLRAADGERSCEFAIEEGVVAEADPRLMGVALENLLRNAWKFTSRREHARIEFGAEAVDGALACYIRDNGAGFDPKYRDKLFTAFQRLHDAREFDGTGIGLATVNRILRRHGGTIWAEGEVNRGACFRFTLQRLRKTAAMGDAA